MSDLNEKDAGLVAEASEALAAESKQSAPQEEHLIGEKEIRSMFWRSMNFDGSFNYERQMSLSIRYALAPVLKKLYPKKEDLADALVRHSEFFNVTPAVAPLVLGIVAAMEEKNAQDPDFDTNSINAVKSSLMGPLSGIGDSIFWGTLRPLAGGIAASLALAANAVAPLLFVLMYNIPQFLVRWFGVHWGYKMGTEFLTKAEKSGIMQKVFHCAAVLGLLVIGGMTASMVSVNLGLSIGSGDGAIDVNSVINGIMPQMLPLLTTLGLSKLLQKGWKVNTLLIAIVVVSIIGAATGILAA